MTFSSVSPVINSYELQGMQKVVINCVTHISIQLNKRNLQNTDKIYDYITNLTSQNKPTIIVSDTNEFKEKHMRIMSALGQTRLNWDTTFKAVRGGTLHQNDLVQYKNIKSMKLIMQIDPTTDNKVNHLSDHAVIAFQGLQQSSNLGLE